MPFPLGRRLVVAGSGNGNAAAYTFAMSEPETEVQTDPNRTSLIIVSDFV